MPVFLSRRAFEAIVLETLETLPEPFRRALENVSIVIEREPRVRHRRLLGICGGTLFGLYEGIPLTERTSAYGMVPPDVITLFQGPLCRAARTRQELEQLIRETVLHELAHYFGISDERLRELGLA